MRSSLCEWMGKYLGFYIFAIFILAGCKTELYRSVPEREANLMVANLHYRGIDAYKEESKPEGYYAIWVEENDFSKAVELLTAQGYPRRARDNLAKLFQPSGLVPTQFEEQVRYVYGLSEELAHTISLFEGVIDNRVHITLPNEEDKDKSKRVSVYIKYDQNFDFSSLTPQIKKLVSDSVSDVAYNDVEILAAPAYFHKSQTPILTAYKFPAGIRVLPEYYGLFIALNIAILLIIAQAAGLALWFYWQWQKTLAKISTPPEEPEGQAPLARAPAPAAPPQIPQGETS